MAKLFHKTISSQALEELNKKLISKVATKTNQSAVAIYSETPDTIKYQRSRVARNEMDVIIPRNPNKIGLYKCKSNFTLGWSLDE